MLLQFSEKDTEDDTTLGMDNDRGDREREHHLISALATLGHMTRCWPPAEKRLLFLICREASLAPGVVKTVLRFVMEGLKYK